MRKLIIMFAMCVLGLFGQLNAQIDVQIGSGDGITTYLPHYPYYNYSVSQQIYTAEEMGGNIGNITSISFLESTGLYGATTRNVEVYMLNTTKENFAGNYDFVNMSTDNLVYSGTYEYSGVDGEWATIQLQTPFAYEGANILLCVVDNTGFWASGVRYHSYNTTDGIRNVYNNNDYYPYYATYLSSTYCYNSYNQDSYTNNIVKFVVDVNGGEEPAIVVTPNPIDLGARPNGYWMRPIDVEVASSGGVFNIAAIEVEDPYFTLPELDMPTTLISTQPISFDITHGEGYGDIAGRLVIAFSETRDVELIDMTAFAYDPVTPDVWELAQEVTEYPFEDSPVNIYDNYLLPGEATDGLDAVYALTFDRDILLTATVDGDDPKVALYAEDFNGGFGPAQDNNFVHEGSLDTEMVVPAGSYYLAASSTTDQFIVNIDTQEIPVPEKPYNPSPEHTATGISNPTLDWEFGRYTVEYQVLLGGQYPPTDVLVDWTNDFDMEIVAENLYHNTNYFWQVNTRNTSGVTYGDIWAFVTTFNIPEDLTVADPTIFEGEDAVLTWTNVQDRSHRGYNVYVDGVKVNESTIFGNTYNVEGLTYNMDGYEIAVSAVYDEGESFLSDPVMVYVSGLGAISGYTFEQDGTTIIAGVTVVIKGTDEFGDIHSYTFTTDANGFYSGEILAGNYEGTASIADYQDTHVTGIVIVYGQTTENVNFNLYEEFYPVFQVQAEEIDDTIF